MEIDPIFDLFIPEIPTALVKTEVLPDVFDELFENGKLAAALGGDRMGHARVEKFAHETSDIDARAERLLKRDRNTPAAPARSDSDAPVIDDGQLLQKMDSHSDRKRRALSLWIRGELALGKSCRELAEYAQRYDPSTARLIEEIGEELEAA